jgi:IclR family pca regulon transcriptional regulator
MSNVKTPAGKSFRASFYKISKGTDAKSVVVSLAKACRVLEVFDGQEPELNLSEIGRLTNLDVGTVHRLVRTLVGLGYLQQAESAKRYRLGLKVIDLGFNSISRIHVQSLSRPILLSLVDSVVGAASIGVLDRSNIVYIDRVQVGLTSLGATRGIGSRIPLYCSAIGRAILAYLSPERRDQILEAEERVKLTPHTITSLRDIRQRIGEVRELGYAFSDQEMIPGVRALAVPILDREGHPLGSLSVAAQSFSMPATKFVEYVAPKALGAARSLASSFQASGSITDAD